MVFVSQYWLTNNEANIKEILKMCDDLDKHPVGPVIKHTINNLRAHALAAQKGVIPDRATTLL